jgi:hypothetical protein
VQFSKNLSVFQKNILTRFSVLDEEEHFFPLRMLISFLSLFEVSHLDSSHPHLTSIFLHRLLVPQLVILP